MDSLPNIEVLTANISIDTSTINEPVDYMARAIMILMQGKDIMQAIERGGPCKSRRFWGLKWKRAQRVAIWPQKVP